MGGCEFEQNTDTKLWSGYTCHTEGEDPSHDTDQAVFSAGRNDRVGLIATGAPYQPNVGYSAVP